MDVRYIGVCCGAGPHHIRAVAEALGRTPPASRYSPDMSRHSFFGTDAKIKPRYQKMAADL
jgi:betaine-homocysteine S-methyltransferase